MEKKIVIAKIKVIKGKENEYLSLIAPLIKNSKAESGNLVYTLYQDTENASEFMVYEEYINEEAFNNHCKTEHVQAFIQQVKPLLDADIDIQTF